MTDTWQHTHVGRFRVEGVLGRGGMGVVLRAYDPHLQRLVAIKVLTERKAQVREGATVNLRERVDHDGLLDEARALAQITDPNVLAVHEIGNERGQTFLVMELVEGADLRAWLSAAPRSLEAIFAVFTQAARGLAAAHRRGIIHRDFKPENLLISADGRVRVCDFGIAAFARSNELIHTGTAGTPRYMAPELWRDQGASVQSDVYAFAATLVEAIIGELPADPAVIERELTKRGVDTRLRAVLSRALDHDMAKRPSSIEDVTRAFTRRRRPRWLVPAASAAVVATSFVAMTLLLRNTDQGGVCEDTSELLSSRWNEREREAVRHGIVAASANAADANDIIARLDDYARTWQKLRDETCTAKVAPSQRPARLACLERRLYDLSGVVRALYRTPSRELAFGRSNSLPDLGSCIEATQVRLPAGSGAHAEIEELTATVLALYDQGLAHLGSEEELEPLAQARARALELGDIELVVRIDRVRGQLLINASQNESAERVFDDAAQLALEHHHDAVAALALIESAAVSRHLDKLDAAESKLRIAKTHLERSPDATPFSRMRLYRELSALAADRNDLPAAYAALDQASQAVARMQPRDPLWTAQLVLARANLLAGEGKLVEALQTARSAEQQLRALGSQGVTELTNALHTIGDLERQRGNRDVALQVFEERLALLARTMPPDNSARVFAEGLVGLAMIDAGRFADAKASFTRTLERIESTPALTRLHADYLGYLARAERLLGDFDRARVLLQTAIAKESRAGHVSAVGFHRISSAFLELEAGDPDAAALYARAAEQQLANEPADHINKLDIADAQISIAFAQGKPVIANQIASRVLALLTERKITDARTERFRLAQASAHNLLGRPREAEPLARAVLDQLAQRNAPALERLAPQAELVLAQYLVDKQPDRLDALRRLVAEMEDPRMRIERARFVRWFEANKLRL